MANHRPGRNPVRLPPDESLHRHCSKHRMLGPCCLCPLMYPDGPDFVKAAMYFATVGPHAGQYVAGCTEDKCGYIGKSITTSGSRLHHTNCIISFIGELLCPTWSLYEVLPAQRYVTRTLRMQSWGCLTYFCGIKHWENGFLLLCFIFLKAPPLEHWTEFQLFIGRSREHLPWWVSI